MFPTISIPKLHNEHRLWVDELNFCKEEIAIYEKHFEALLIKNTDVVVRAKVEQFQKQFIREKEVIDELRHKLNGCEKQLASFVRELSGLGLESIKMDNHSGVREEMQTFRKIFTELQKAFRSFEKAWY